MNISIAIDAMGGDYGPSKTVPATLRLLQKYNDVHFILIGDKPILSKALADNNGTLKDQISIQHASEVIDMHESPHKALRYKKDSSMRVAINLVHSSDAHACVSAGNTGALMAIAKFVLNTLPGIERPAICCALPTLSEPTYMLDLGANIDVSAEKLLQFAMMGAELVNITENIESPTVALLNIGTEDIKGNDQIKLVAKLLTESYLNYCGFIEGTDIYTGKCNVIVCDGLIGNIALKVSEGTVLKLQQVARDIASNSLYGRCIGLLSKPLLSRVSRIMNPDMYNGASLLGLQGIVVKSHGNANQVAFANAIEVAIIEARSNIIEKISARFDK